MALEAAVTGWLTGGLRAASMVGQTLGDAPSFRWDAGRAADVERFRQLTALLGRSSATVAGYAGYEDGSFVLSAVPPPCRLHCAPSSPRPKVSPDRAPHRR